MLYDEYNASDICPDCNECELILSCFELVDSMVKDIQHLKAETIRARYELSEKYDPEHEWITSCDILSNLNMPHYENTAYKAYTDMYYAGGDPLEFKEFADSMAHLAKGYDDGKY